MAVSHRPNLLIIKAHFFLYFGGVSTVIFMPTFVKQLGFSAVLVGSIFTVLPLISVLAKLLMGAFADRYKCHKPLIMFCLIISTISYLSLTFITPINKKVGAELICNNDSMIRICSEQNIEKCMESKIKSQYNQANLSINCEMECIVDNQFIDSFCETWNGSQYCQIQGNKYKQLKSTEVERATDIYNDNILINNNNKTVNSLNIMYPTEATLLILRFDVNLMPHQVKQEGRCLSIQIGGVRDTGHKQEYLHTPNCESPRAFTCRMVCDSPALTEIGKIVDEDKTNGYNQLWQFMFISTISWIASSTITCLGETICFGLLDDQPSEFGKQRLWGSLGWGIMSLTGGFLVDIVSGNRTQKNYKPIFYTSAALMVVDAIIASRIKDRKRVKSENIIWDVGKLFTNFRIIIYVVWCICMGMSNGIILNFLFWHLEDLTSCDGLENIKTLEGFYVTLQTICGELPSFFLNAWILNKIGHVNSMSLTLFAFGATFVMFSILDKPIYFLPISLLNGITFSTMYATMTSYASIIAPPGTEATMQGLVGAVYEGLGMSFGSFITGLLMHYWKGRKVFFHCGIVILLICILHIIIQFFLQRYENAFPVTTENGTRKGVQYTSPENAVEILNDSKTEKKDSVI